jgi:hypothetical protein
MTHFIIQKLIHFVFKNQIVLNRPMYTVIINDCPIVDGVGDVVECAASLIT